MAMVQEHGRAYQTIWQITRKTSQMLLWSMRNQRLWPDCLWSRNPPRWQEDWSSNQCSEAKMRIWSAFVPQVDKLLFQIHTWLQQRYIPPMQIDQDHQFLSLGKKRRWKLHKTQASPSKPTGIGTLQPHCTYPACSRRITLGVMSSIATAASRFHIPINCLWKLLTNRSWNVIRSIRERISCNRIWLQTLPPISVWKKLRARNWPPPTWTHLQAKNQFSRQMHPRQSGKMGSTTLRVWFQGSLPARQTQPGWLIVTLTHQVTTE